MFRTFAILFRCIWKYGALAGILVKSLPILAQEENPTFSKTNTKLIFCRFSYLHVCTFLGKPSFKKIYFAKKFHKTVTPPPQGFYESLFFLLVFWGIYINYKKKQRYEIQMTPPPVCETFSQNRFFLKDGFPKQIC